MSVCVQAFHSHLNVLYINSFTRKLMLSQISLKIMVQVFVTFLLYFSYNVYVNMILVIIYEVETFLVAVLSRKFGKALIFLQETIPKML